MNQPPTPASHLQRRRFMARGLQTAAWAAAGALSAPAWSAASADTGSTSASTNASAKSQRADGQPFHVLMITYRGTTDVDRGFRTYLAETGLNVRFTVRDVQQDVSRISAILQEVPALAPDLIYVWGTPITLAVVGAYDAQPVPTQIHNIPVVFALVAEPHKARIVNNLQAPERNVTGAVHVVPLETQLRLMHSYQPFDKLAVLYNAKEQNSQAIVQQLREHSGQRKNELIAHSFHTDANGNPSSDGVEELIAQMRQAGAQWLYLLPDTFLGTIYNRITPAALAQKLPTFGATEVAVRSGGALAGLVSRYYSVGQLAGSKAADILRGQKTVRDVPVETLKRFSLMVNMQAARQLQLYPPIDLLNYAEVIAIGPAGMGAGAKGVAS